MDDTREQARTIREKRAAAAAATTSPGTGQPSLRRRTRWKGDGLVQPLLRGDSESSV